MAEEWRPVPGWEGSYEVSDQGRVRGLERRVQRGNHTVRVPARMLGLCNARHGYKVVALGRSEKRLLHRLVLETFVGPPPADKPECCHNDGDPSNNHLSNLRWGDRVDNMQDMLRHGRHRSARKTHCDQGHEFTPENTDHDGTKRICKSCRRDVFDRFYARRRAQRRAEGRRARWIDEAVARQVAEALASGETGVSIARRLGVGQATVSRIRNGQRRAA